MTAVTNGAPLRDRAAPNVASPEVRQSPIAIGDFAMKFSDGFPVAQKPIPARSQTWNDNSRPPGPMLRKPRPRYSNQQRYSLPYPPPPNPSNRQLERRHSYAPTISSPLNPLEPSKPSSVDDLALIGGSSSSSGALSRSTSSENTNSRKSQSSDASNTGRPDSKAIFLSEKPPILARRNSNKLRKKGPSVIAPNQIQTSRYSVGSLHNLGRSYDRYPRFYFDPMGRKVERDRLSSEGPVPEVDPEKEFSPYIDDRIGAKCPYVEGAFPMFLEDKEGDDYLHEPDPSYDKGRRMPTLKELGFRGFFNVFFFFLLSLGLVIVFIVVPVVTFSSGKVGRNYFTPAKPNDWSTVNSRVYSNVKGIRMNMVDPDTPRSAYTRKSVNGDTLNLVFSDEFNEDGRTFYTGDDQFWEAVNLNYHATGDMEWYDEDAITTKDGTLRIRFDQFRNHDLNYRSGMLQSWNKLCFKGGVLEVSVSLPGPAGVPGLWPGIWTLGNLARPGYSATSEGLWPYSYNECDVGITPNQSSTDGISYLPGQKLNSCTCKGEDHPNRGVGRGAPEIDVFEASANGDLKLGVVTQSLQVAPFDIWYQPNYDFISIYNKSVTAMNAYRGGVYQQAISGVTTLNNNWYDGKQYQKYAFEYQTKSKKSAGFITWFVGDDQAFTLWGEATGPNGNVKNRDISLEPMSIILNLGLSGGWTWIDTPNLKFPTTMYIDYVRIYQPPNAQSLTCDPPGFPTTQYIQDHLKAYQIWNYTTWNDTGYDWPKNSLMNKC